MQTQKRKLPDGILDAVGNTPLVQLSRYLDQSRVRLYAKLEAFQPGGSAKARPALAMIQSALESGQIRPGSTVIESSSGNMGIGLAQTCRRFGLRFICVVDPNAQQQNVDIMRALGAEIDRVTEPVHGNFLSARLARVCYLLENTNNSFWPNQYANLDNPLAHQRGTIREIDGALGDDLDYLFVATSSTGTIRGCQDYLRQLGRSTTVVAVDAVGSVLFGGNPGPRSIPGLGAGRLPPLARDCDVKVVQRVTDLDCVVGCRRMAQREAVLVGGSAGGVLESVRRMQSLLQGKTCVAILHDSGTRYLDTVFNDDWVQTELGRSPRQIAELVQNGSDPSRCYGQCGAA
ncbi:MAG: 2,3-diaminopropionate biosynthesis protein SbnA [Pirellulaceae bacterium]|nr:2,3-diaminopropionate biosynthesis protein SbnA [Pirellulaceae bacterium]